MSPLIILSTKCSTNLIHHRHLIIVVITDNKIPSNKLIDLKISYQIIFLQEKSLTKSLQRGEDPHFDQVRFIK
jgi:hypothetical protein